MIHIDQQTPTMKSNNKPCWIAAVGATLVLAIGISLVFYFTLEIDIAANSFWLSLWTSQKISKANLLNLIEL